jgi:tetratricopeptide (TPR) repeat protein
MCIKTTTFFIIFLFIGPLSYGTTNEEELLNIEEKLYFYPAQGEELLHIFIDRYQNDTLNDYQGHIYFLQGLLAYEKAETDSAITCLGNALVLFMEKDNKLYQAKSEIVLGWIYEKIGCYVEAKLNYLKVIDLVDENSARELGMAHLGLVRCKRALKEPVESENEGIDLLKSLHKKEYALYADFISCLINQTDKDITSKLKRIASSYAKLGMERNVASAYKSIAFSYINKRQLDSALIYIEKAHPLCNSEYPIISLAPALIQAKGYIYLLKEEYETARVYLNESLTLSENLNQPYTKQFIYECLFRIDTLEGNYKEGIRTLLLAQDNKELNLNQSKQYITKVMEVSANINVIKEDIVRLKNKRKVTILLFITLIIVVFLILTILWLVDIKKKQKIIIEERGIKLGLSYLIYNLSEINILTRFYTLTEEEKSKFINLNDQFEIAYARSITKMRKLFTNLSNSEIRYAVLFAMNLSDELIAKIRNVNLDSVQKTKRRLREKIGLEKGADLKEYFRGFLGKEYDRSK